MPVMSELLRLSRFRVLRLPLLALLLLAVLANPVLAALGDLHGIQDGGGHVHSVDTHHDDRFDSLHGDEEGDESLLHALMHASHCCGHPTAIVSTPIRVLAMILHEIMPALDTISTAPAPPTSLLRPPIAV